MAEKIDVKCGSDVTTYQTCEFIAQRYVDACARSTNEAATDSLASVWDAKRDTAQQIVNHIRQFRQQAERHAPVIPEAIKVIVTALYFDDSSDYQGALWDALRLLDSDTAQLLESNPSAAYAKHHPEDVEAFSVSVRGAALNERKG